jgi:hypothetical protein
VSHAGCDNPLFVPDDTASTSWDAACMQLLHLMHETALRTKDNVLIPDIHLYTSRGCPPMLLVEMWRTLADPRSAERL